MSNLQGPKMADCQPLNLSKSSRAQQTAEHHAQAQSQVNEGASTSKSSNNFHNSVNNGISTKHQPTISSKFCTVSSSHSSTFNLSSKINSQAELDKEAIRCSAKKAKEYAASGHFNEDQLMTDFNIIGELTHNCLGEEKCTNTRCRCFHGGYSLGIKDIASGKLTSDPGSLSRAKAIQATVDVIGPMRLQELKRAAQVQRMKVQLRRGQPVTSSLNGNNFNSPSQPQSLKRINAEIGRVEPEQHVRAKQAIFTDMLGVDFFSSSPSSTRQNSTSNISSPLGPCNEGGVPVGMTKKERVANILQHIMATSYQPPSQKKNAELRAMQRKKKQLIEQFAREGPREEQLFRPFNLEKRYSSVPVATPKSSLHMSKSGFPKNGSQPSPKSLFKKPTPLQERLASAAVPVRMQAKGGVFAPKNKGSAQLKSSISSTFTSTNASSSSEQMRRRTVATNSIEPRSKGVSVRPIVAPKQTSKTVHTNGTNGVLKKSQGVPPAAVVPSFTKSINKNGSTVSGSLSPENYNYDDVVNRKSQTNCPPHQLLITHQQQKQLQQQKQQQQQKLQQEEQTQLSVATQSKENDSQLQQPDVILLEEDITLSPAPQKVPEANPPADMLETTEPNASPSPLVINIDDDDSQPETETETTPSTANVVEKEAQPTPQLRPLVVNIKLPRAAPVVSIVPAEDAAKQPEQNATAKEQSQLLPTKTALVKAKPEEIKTAVQPFETTPERESLVIRLRMTDQDGDRRNYRIDPPTTNAIDHEKTIEKENKAHSSPAASPPPQSPLSLALPEQGTSSVTLTTALKPADANEVNDEIAVVVNPIATRDEEEEGVRTENEVEMPNFATVIVDPAEKEITVTETTQSAVSVGEKSAELDDVNENKVTSSVDAATSEQTTEEQEVVNTDGKEAVTSSTVVEDEVPIEQAADAKDGISNEEAVDELDDLSAKKNDVPVENADTPVAEITVTPNAEEMKEVTPSLTDQHSGDSSQDESIAQTSESEMVSESSEKSSVSYELVEKAVSENDTSFSSSLLAEQTTTSQSTLLTELKTSMSTSTSTPMLAKKRGRPRKDDQTRMAEQLKKQQEFTAALNEERSRRSIKKAEIEELKQQPILQTPPSSPPIVSEINETQTTETPTPRRGRGRPRKYPIPFPLAAQTETPTKIVPHLQPGTSSPDVSLEKSLVVAKSSNEICQPNTTSLVSPEEEKLKTEPLLDEISFEKKVDHVLDESQTLQKDIDVEEVIESSSNSRPRTRHSSTEHPETAVDDAVSEKSETLAKLVLPEQSTPKSSKQIQIRLPSTESHIKTPDNVESSSRLRRTRLSSTELAAVEVVSECSKSPTKTVLPEQPKTDPTSSESSSAQRRTRLSSLDQAQKSPEIESQSTGQVGKPTIVNVVSNVGIHEQPRQTPETVATVAAEGEQIRRSFRQRTKAEQQQSEKTEEFADDHSENLRGSKRPASLFDEEDYQSTTRRSIRQAIKLETQRCISESKNDHIKDEDESDATYSKASRGFSGTLSSSTATPKRMSARISTAKKQKKEEEVEEKMKKSRTSVKKNKKKATLKTGNNMITYRLDCRVCGKSFRMNDKLNAHLHKVHNEQPFCCLYGCKGISFTTR